MSDNGKEHKKSMLITEVIYAKALRQFVTQVRLEEGSTFGDAVRKSGVLEIFPELDCRELKLGSYGRIRKTDEALLPGDRVEIYREITADPRTAARKRKVVGEG
ncbi:MAG: RnfH family protein [Succinivibrionaceae bacterium]|nr:RnfH family protein [Succinivibrionaceae bacterium]